MLLPLDISPSQSIQPFDESYKDILIFVFPKSKSEFFPFALKIAKSAKFYCESHVFNKDHFFVGFELVPDQIKTALALSRYIGDWKGVYALINGMEKSIYFLNITLSCILESQLAKEPKKYCCSISNNFIKNDDSYWIHPCRIVLTQQTHFKIIPNLELTMKDQIFAQAIANGCEWCPNLNLDNLKQIDINLMLKDVK
ncbi:hypothetical protein [Acinetobacter haemolyticus]|uniref:hypothetical protein n=1 Tax=Acinetobacter haemolyticus TaxID=29430 RepID=UPI0002D07EDE|nr:hypothetical protein [Acinetobacter haemolyticus]ENW20973.1 hypothetical protein F926_01748 [Acinetobacter haemolyticus NIPH 261]